MESEKHSAKVLPNAPERISSLDGLRALAIVLVVASHSKNDFIHAGGLAEPAWLFQILSYAWTGVDLFFVLSGFLIGRILFLEIQKTGSLRLGRFLLMRGFRIWPLYYFVCILALFKLYVSGATPSLKAIVPDLLLVTNYFKETLAFGSWSLSMEEQFYLFTSVALLLVFRSSFPKKTTALKITSVFIFLLLLAPILRTFTWGYFRNQQMEPFALEWDIIHSHLTTHYDALVVGLVFACVTVFFPHSSLIKKRIGVALTLACIGCSALTYCNRIAFSYSLIACLFGALVWRCLQYPESKIARAFSWTGFRAISRLSYGIYLWYRFPLWKIAQGVVNRVPGLSPVIQVGLIFIIAFAVASLASSVTFALIEQPFLKLRARLFSDSTDTLVPLDNPNVHPKPLMIEVT